MSDQFDIAMAAACQGLEAHEIDEQGLVGYEISKALRRAAKIDRSVPVLAQVANELNAKWPEKSRIDHQLLHNLIVTAIDSHGLDLDDNPEPVKLCDMKPKATSRVVKDHPDLRPAVIDGLLRQGETCNIIAAPKIGKSMMAMSLSLSVAIGRPWLGMTTHAGDVLYIDNEVHPETFGHRAARIAQEMAAPDALDHVHLISLRGALVDIITMRPFVIEWAQACKASVIVLDALYRLLPPKTDENNNAAMAFVYNALDWISKETGVAIICIHHTSKGNQGEKATADVGAGAGAISRAADTHIILREHEEAPYVVVDAMARSWPPMAGFVVTRDEGMLWRVASDVDPQRLKGKRRQTTAEASMNLEGFLARFLPMLPASVSEIRMATEECGVRLGVDRIKGYLDMAVTQGKAVREIGARGCAKYGRGHSGGGGTVSERVGLYMKSHPKASYPEIATACGCSLKTVQRVHSEGAVGRVDNVVDNVVDKVVDNLGCPLDNLPRVSPLRDTQGCPCPPPCPPPPCPPQPRVAKMESTPAEDEDLFRPSELTPGGILVDDKDSLAVSGTQPTPPPF